MIYEKKTDNRAYVDGYTKGLQANGLDWARAELALVELKNKIAEMLAEKDRQIVRLKMDIADRDAKIVDLESRLEAAHVAWKHRNDD